MLGFTSISSLGQRDLKPRPPYIFGASYDHILFHSDLKSRWPKFTILALLLPTLSLAQGRPNEEFQTGFEPAPGSTVDQEEAEDFRKSPYTDYADFNEEEEEAEAARFFQFGRFFGVSIGAGFEGVTGNRGLLWEGGLPLITMRMHYWFDFNFAIQIEGYTVNHFYSEGNNKVDVNILHLGVDLKYYFDTRNLPDAITFAGPYVLAGGGSFDKTETDTLSGTADNKANFGFNFGAGLEFLVSPRKVYFDLEAKYSFVNYDDRFSARFQNQGIQDLTGGFWNITGSILFTW